MVALRHMFEDLAVAVGEGVRRWYKWASAHVVIGTFTGFLMLAPVALQIVIVLFGASFSDCVALLGYLFFVCYPMAVWEITKQRRLENS